MKKNVGVICVFFCVFVCFFVWILASLASRSSEGYSLNRKMGPAWPPRRMWVLCMVSVTLSSAVAEARADETVEGPADAETASGALTISVALFMPR